MRLTALKEIKYDDVVHKVGDEFDCENQEHARMLCGWGKTKEAEPSSETAGPTYQTKGDLLKGDDDSEQRRGRRSYRRRDMVPER